jgi:hypothetical protein
MDTQLKENIINDLGFKSPGTEAKFIPNTPARNDSGMNIAEKIVSVIIILFMSLLAPDI